MTKIDQEAICPICNREFKSQRAMRTHISRSDCKDFLCQTEGCWNAQENCEYCDPCQEALYQQDLDESQPVEGIENDTWYCLCGCGEEVAKGRLFKQGHDMKLKSMIKRGEVLTQTQRNYAVDNWSDFLKKWTK